MYSFTNKFRSPMVRGGFEPSDANSNKHIGNYFSSLNLKSWEHVFGTISFLLIYQTFASIYVKHIQRFKRSKDTHIEQSRQHYIFSPSFRNFCKEENKKSP